MPSPTESYEAIRAAFRPPADAACWDAIERDIGLRLPGSYKAQGRGLSIALVVPASAAASPTASASTAPRLYVRWARDAVELLFFEVNRGADPDRWRIVAPTVDGDLAIAEETDAAVFLARRLGVGPTA